jgi:hypothetical protein
MEKADLISSGMILFAESMLWLARCSAHCRLLCAAAIPPKNRTQRCYNLIYKIS